LTRARSSHEQKTWDERRAYLETTVRPNLTPTAQEPTEGIDPTGATAGGARAELTRLSPRTRSRKPRFPELRENLPKVIVGIVAIPLTSWVLFQLYSLNREVGELRVKGDGMEKRLEQLKGDLERSQEQLRQEMDRINDRLNGVPKRRP